MNGFRPLLALALLSGCTAAGTQQRTPMNASIPADGVTRVEIRSRSGSLRVIGQPGAPAVIVRGTARGSSRAVLSRIRLVAERRGDVIHIEAMLPESRRRIGLGGIRTSSAALDLLIELPAAIAVAATNGGGDAEFRATGDLRVRDASGALRIEDILGSVTIHDGPGAIRMLNVAGPVDITDGSGAIHVEGVGRDLTVRDGSGAIVIRRVGNVHIPTDGSGNIDIRDATGSVRIGSPGSGRVAVREVGGDLIVERGRRSRVTHSAVQGRISIPDR